MIAPTFPRIAGRRAGAIARTLLVACALLAIVSTRLALAQTGDDKPVVRATVSVERVYLGDSAVLQISIEGPRDVAAPDVSAIKNADVVYRGPQVSSSTYSTIENGQFRSTTSTTTSHLYSVTPQRLGKLTIPSFTLNVAGKSYSTNPITIDVVEPTQSTDVALELTAEAPTAYVGQPVRLRMTWTLGRKVREYALRFPTIDGADLLPGPDPRPPGTSPNDSRFLQMRVGDDDAFAQVSSTTINNRSITVVTLERVLIPRRPGRLTIGAVRADFNAIIGERPRDPRDNPWQERAILDRQTASSKPVTIDVRDLPAKGRPAEFSGLIGSYALAARVNTADVSVGDPMDLSVVVTGPYPLSLVGPLDLSRQPLARTFRAPRDPLLPETTSTTATFTGQIRARSPKVDSIPPLELNYFDPATGAYEVARSQPIPISVRASTTVTLDGDDTPLGPDVADPRPKDERLAGLAPPSRDPLAPLPPALARSPGELLGPHWLPAAGILGAVLVSAASLFRVVRHLRHRDPDAVRRRHALSTFRRELAHARRAQGTENATALARALTNYAARRAGLAPDTLTSTEAAGIIDSHAPALSPEVRAILSQCDLARYAPLHAPVPPAPIEHARDLVHRMHRNWSVAGAGGRA